MSAGNINGSMIRLLPMMLVITIVYVPALGKATAPFITRVIRCATSPAEKPCRDPHDIKIAIWYAQSALIRVNARIP